MPMLPETVNSAAKLPQEHPAILRRVRFDRQTLDLMAKVVAEMQMSGKRRVRHSNDETIVTAFVHVERPGDEAVNIHIAPKYRGG